MQNKLVESIHTIRFQDCDPFHHLNNSRYIDYFINAREDQEKEAFGFDVYEYANKTGKSWVVGQNQIAYFSPALLMEKVYIQSTLLEWNKADILIEMRMWNEAKTQLKSLLWTRYIHYDLKEKKRAEHDEYLNRIFQQYENPLDEETTFEQRLVNIKRTVLELS